MANSSLPQTLQAQIDALYKKSVEECHTYYAGDLGCIKSQFALNYHWEIFEGSERHDRSCRCSRAIRGRDRHSHAQQDKERLVISSGAPLSALR